jgi:hypothetical protein
MQSAASVAQAVQACENGSARSEGDFVILSAANIPIHTLKLNGTVATPAFKRVKRTAPHLRTLPPEGTH